VNIRRLNHAVLYVRDARRSASFYQQVLGFEPVIVDDQGTYAFLRAPGSDNHHDIAFFTVGSGAAGPAPQTVGLYHIAWEVPTIADLVTARAELAAAGALVGESDHAVNKSLYARDPDGLEFEVMYLTPATEWGDDEHRAIVRPLDLVGEQRREQQRETAQATS
jgi:catechol-2,3-dioxygenase